jgi:hypothetical protein
MNADADARRFGHPNGRSFDERNPQDPTGEPLFLHSFEAAPKAIELLPGPKRSNSSEIDEVTRLVSSESSRMMDEVTRLVDSDWLRVGHVA